MRVKKMFVEVLEVVMDKRGFSSVEFISGEKVLISSCPGTVVFDMEVDAQPNPPITPVRMASLPPTPPQDERRTEERPNTRPVEKHETSSPVDAILAQTADRSNLPFRANDEARPLPSGNDLLNIAVGMNGVYNGSPEKRSRVIAWLAGLERAKLFEVRGVLCQELRTAVVAYIQKKEEGEGRGTMLPPLLAMIANGDERSVDAPVDWLQRKNLGTSPNAEKNDRHIRELESVGAYGGTPSTELTIDPGTKLDDIARKEVDKYDQADIDSAKAIANLPANVVPSSVDHLLLG